MSLIKKLILTSIASSSVYAYASQTYVYVQCNMNPAATLTATYSDPITGKTRMADSCGEALAQVPANYMLATHDAAGSTASFVNYLFMLNGMVPQTQSK